MSRRLFRLFGILLITSRVWTAVAVAQASNAATLSGSYAVQGQADSGGQVKAALQIRLQNRGAHDLHIQRITLWDFSHPAQGASRPCSIAVPAGGSSNTTQEFIVPRNEYELWKRGSLPRVVLQIATPNGRPTTAVVRLDRLSGGRATRP